MWEITDTYFWKPQDKVSRWEYEAGDVIYVARRTRSTSILMRTQTNLCA